MRDVSLWAFFACHSALRLVGLEPEPSQATDMALACCFMGKVLWVGCHYFSPAFRHSNLRRQVPSRLHNARDPSSEQWNYGRECCPVNLAEMTTSTPFWDLLHDAKCDMGPTALLPLRRKMCWEFFIRPKNPTASAGFAPAKLGTRGQLNLKILRS